MNQWGDLQSPQTPLASDKSEMMPSLPGRSLPGEGCGSEIPYFCNCCNHHFIVSSSCMLRTCPNCWRKWAWKEAKRAGLRMWAGSRLRVGKRKTYRIVHAVVSLPSGASLPKQRKSARESAKRHGISGGFLIWHPFRQPEDKFVPDGYDHFHIIGLARGDIKPGIDKEIIFKVIIDAKRNDYRGFQRCSEIKAATFYLLTHCGILKGRSSLTWFGELSYNQLSNGALLDAHPDMADTFNKSTRLCPQCHSDDIEPAWFMDWTNGSNPVFVNNWIPG